MSNPDPPRSALPDNAQQVLAIVRALARELRQGVLDTETLGLDHALERDFGLDSLARVELLARIEQNLHVRVLPEALSTAETPRDLLRLLTPDGDEATPALPTQPTPHAGPVAAASGSPPSDVTTLTGLLDWHAEKHPTQVWLTLYDEHDQTSTITYGDLREAARAFAASLLARELGRQARVALMLPTGHAFFTAFFGVLYAGCVPVPLYPPTRPAQREDHLRRIAGILASAGAALFVADAATQPFGPLLQARCPDLRGIVTVEASGTAHAGPDDWPAIDTNDIAFLQYTSGSTGQPKGVTLSHANLLANLRAMQIASGIGPHDIFVSWLPLYHDMGLIGAVLGSLCIGFPLVLMPPLAFLARPARWLRAIHRHRATVSAAPNFAYEVCAGKIDDKDLVGLDLACWRIAFNGAEPVSPPTLERFATRFARHGFRRTALTPVYGLAENALGLAFPPPGRGPMIDTLDRTALMDSAIARPSTGEAATPIRIASCGRPLPGHELRIVDAGSVALPERRIGRVQFRGPSATAGYFGNAEAAAQLFDGDWLNSGDLGYMADGELYLTGRSKDIIIRGGHNIYPQELEEAVGQLDGVRRGGVAAFPATGGDIGSERLVLLVETHVDDAAERQRLVAAINALAVDLAGLPADDIVLASPHTVPKTSSGKIRRAACREAYERGTLLTARRPHAWLAIRKRAMALTTTVGSASWAVWAWAVFLGLVPVAWLAIVLAPSLTLRRRIARIAARTMLRLSGLAPQVTGQTSEETHCIAVSNHASYLDALVLVAVLPPRFAYVAKRELFDKPFAAIPLRRLGCIFVERFESAQSVEDVGALARLAQSGESLLFFAEGTFRTEPGLLPFHLGAFSIAARCNLPLIALALSGTRRLLPGQTRWPRFSRLRLDIAPPLRAEGSDGEAVLHLRDSARRWILQHLDEPNAS